MFNFKSVKVEEPKAKNLSVTWTLFYADEAEVAPKPEKTLGERIISVLLKPFTFICGQIFVKKTEPAQECGWAYTDITLEGAKADMPDFSSQVRVGQYKRSKMTDLPFYVKNNDLPAINATDEHGVERVKEDFKTVNSEMSHSEVSLRIEGLNGHYEKLDAAEIKRQKAWDARNQKVAIKNTVVGVHKESIAKDNAEGIRLEQDISAEKQDQAAQNRLSLQEEKQAKLAVAAERRAAAKEKGDKLRAEAANDSMSVIQQEMQILFAMQKESSDEVSKLREQLQDVQAEKSQPERGLLHFFHIRKNRVRH